MKKVYQLLILLTIILITSACAEKEAKTSATESNELKNVSFVLDWTPNTNHIGVYVAQEKGYFKDTGLDVQIMLPGEVRAEQLIGSGKGDFGVSYQNQLIQARAEGIPIVSVAAIIQHNTAGYAAPVDKDIKSPKDFEDKVFGAVGSSLERANMALIMERDGGDVEKVDFVTMGAADYFASTERGGIDFSGIFYGWTGIEAEIRGVDLNMVYSTDFAEELDTYSPLIATSEKMIEEDPETVEAFVQAVAKGYAFAIENPSDAAQILIDSEPDIDPELIKRSLDWLAPRYQDDAEQWGIQEHTRWQIFTDFIFEHKIIDQEIDVDHAFTNEFLPNKD